MNEDAAFLGNPYELKIRYSRFYNVDLLINQIAIRSIEKLSKSVDPVPEAIKFKPIIIHGKKKKSHNTKCPDFSSSPIAPFLF